MEELNEAIKNDSEKVELHVLPFLALEEVGFAMAYGVRKYGEYNWAQGEGISWSRYFNACLRHLWMFWRGNDLDQESKRHHLGHAGACLLILLEMALLQKGKDNRPKYYIQK